MKRLIGLTGFLVFFFYSLAANAANLTSPAGTWTTISDKDGKPRAVVSISVSGNTLSGRIIKVFPRAGDHSVCTKCTGARKDKPIVGMTIIWGFKKQSATFWKDGSILDPENGKVYRCQITLAAGGKKLIVRGYVGVSALGRNQTWVR